MSDSPEWLANKSESSGVQRLPVNGHANLIASNSIKARLQIQYAMDKGSRFYKGPIDCCRKMVCHS